MSSARVRSFSITALSPRRSLGLIQTSHAYASSIRCSMLNFTLGQGTWPSSQSLGQLPPQTGSMDMRGGGLSGVDVVEEPAQFTASIGVDGPVQVTDLVDVVRLVPGSVVDHLQSHPASPTGYRPGPGSPPCN